jgi:hypothetical protein
MVRFSVPNQASPNEYTLGDIWLNGQGVIDDGQNMYSLQLANNDYFFQVCPHRCVRLMAIAELLKI